MKVFVASSWYPTPKNPRAVPFITEQVSALAERGCEVTVLSVELVSLRSGEKAGFSKRIENGVEIYQFILPVYRFGSMSFSAKLTTLLMKKLFDRAVAEKGIPDIVHIHSFRFAGKAASEKAKQYGIPSVLTEHYSNLGTDSLTDTEKEYLNRTKPDRTIAVSKALAARLKALNIECEVITNFVDTDIFRYSPVTHEDFTFVCCCRLTKGKAVDMLLRAFASVDNCRLKIVGKGAEYDSLNSLAGELGLSERVEFVGEVSHTALADILNECDCFVLPSRGETFGVVYIEAMACGLPVIATKCGGPNEIVDESNGILIDIDDIDGLISAMIDVRDGNKKFDECQIRQNCEEKYGKNNIVEKLISMYNNMVK